MSIMYFSSKNIYKAYLLGTIARSHSLGKWKTEVKLTNQT